MKNFLKLAAYFEVDPFWLAGYNTRTLKVSGRDYNLGGWMLQKKARNETQ